MKSGSNSTSLELTWNPVFVSKGAFSLGGQFGGTIFSHKPAPGRSSESFFVWEYGLAVGYQFGSFAPELLAGYQNWTKGNGGNVFSYGANVSYIFDDKLFSLVDRVYVGYGRSSMKGYDVGLARIGFGMNF